jgi:DNA-binding MarR family transcriptional regulator
MSLTQGPVPQDLSGLRDAPLAEVAPLLERAAAEQELEHLEAVTALLLDRAFQVLRQGSRQDVLEEAKSLNRVLAGAGGESLKSNLPLVYGGWSALGELLSEAARRSDRAAVESILLATRGHGQLLLELLAREGRPLPRTEVRSRLGLGESHLSHLLRDLEEADLIARYRPEGSREVLLELGPAGRQVSDRSILPEWVRKLADLLGEIAEGRSISSEEIARKLRTAGAPSQLAAERLAGAVANLQARAAVPAPAAEPAAEADSARGRLLRFTRKVEALPEDQGHLQRMRARQGEQSPRAMFGAGGEVPPH